MNNKESFELFAQGKDAWNAWAANMLAEREALEAAGTWTAGTEKSEWNDATQAWHAEANTDFFSHKFNETADFSGFVFPGSTWFHRATFSGDAVFRGATFSGEADFHGATFSGDAEFVSATFSGEAVFSWATFSGKVEFVSATFSGEASFLNATFSDDAQFREARFSDNAWFTNATFSDDAQFSEARFSDNAWFTNATFSDNAWFTNARFSDKAWFSQARFSGFTFFGETTFSDDASFLQAVFESLTLFDNVRFEKAADFRAIKSESVFSFAHATFLAVPDFVQAHFAEASQLDEFRIQPRGFRRPTPADVKNYFEGDRNLSPRWRALKRLALQGHDHVREHAFFKGELKSRRWCTDKPWHIAFWSGWAYQLLSDFGRSIVRPLLWWVASAVAFAPLYLGAHFDRAGNAFSAVGWTIDRFVLQPVGAAVASPLNCLAGWGDPWWAALGISARKSLLFFGLDSSDKLTQNYACLYGVISQKPAPLGQLPASFYLDVPNSVIAFGIAQHIISAVLLFLFLLAIRNHFRIR